MVLSRKVNNLEKSDCENLAEEKTDETTLKHIREQNKSDSTLSARNCLLNRKVENVVMNERTRSWKIGEGTTFEKHS